MLKRIQDYLIYKDHIVWYYINVKWHNSFLDAVLPFFRNQWFLTPLYFFLILFIPSRFGKKGWLWCLGFLFTFIISDQLSAHLLKPLFHRLRPCNSPLLTNFIHLIVPCGGQYGFPSSHAANHFALAVFSGITMRKYAPWLMPVVVIYAALVCYAQVYVGVHYPLDVLFGAFLGTVVGIFSGKVFKSKVAL